MMFRKENPIMLQCAAVLAVLVIALSGCGPTPSPTPTATQPPPLVALVVNPDITEVLAGQTLTLIAETSGKDLSFKWSAARGKLSTFDEAAVFYTAPDSAGVDTVTVEVRSSSGTTIKHVRLNVIVPDTPTPAATPTNTQTPVDTSTPTFTPSPPLVDTPTPTFTPSPSPTPTADIRFWADSEQLNAGSCTTINWHVSNVNAYWIDGQPRAGDNGSFQTCPCQDETHTLRVVRGDGSEQNLSVTIRVSGQCVKPPPSHTPTPPPTCLITQPVDGDDNLGFENEVRVTCSDVPDSLYIWILVYSFSDSKFYPKPGPIGSGSGDYRGTAYLGIEGPGPGTGIGDQYGIIVALADEVVSRELRQAAAIFSGYVLKLPGGVEEKARITVKRGH